MSILPWSQNSQERMMGLHHPKKKKNKQITQPKRMVNLKIKIKIKINKIKVKMIQLKVVNTVVWIIIQLKSVITRIQMANLEVVRDSIIDREVKIVVVVDVNIVLHSLIPN